MLPSPDYFAGDLGNRGELSRKEPTWTKGISVGNAGRFYRRLKFRHSSTSGASKSFVETIGLLACSRAACVGSALGHGTGEVHKSQVAILKPPVSGFLLDVDLALCRQVTSGTCSCYRMRRTPQSMGAKCAAQGSLHRGRMGSRRPAGRRSPACARSRPQVRQGIGSVSRWS